MLHVPRSIRILLAAERIDMRNSIDGLAAIVRNQWKENLFAGHLVVFVSKKGDRLKILSWDSGGFVLTYKRLEQGRFRLPAFQNEALGVQLDGTQLAMLLDGIDVSHVRRPKKWSPPVIVWDRQASESLIYPDRWRSARRATSTTANGAPKQSRSGPAPRTRRPKRSR